MRLFVSHIHEEVSLAVALKNQFERIFAGMVEVFLSEEIRPGEDWLMAIKSALQNADIILVLFSPSSHSRPWINIEAGYGIMAAKSVVPICCLGLRKERLPVIYGLRQALYLTERVDVLKLLETIAESTPAKRLMVEDKHRLLDDWLDAANAAAAVIPPYTRPAGSPIVLWLMGSVNELGEEHRGRAFKTADALADAFISRGYRIVLGRNLLLNYIADRIAVGEISKVPEQPGDIPQLLATKSARSGNLSPNPVVVLGSLRPVTSVRKLFIDVIGKVPDVALLLGGAVNGRAEEEARLASEAGIPVLPLRFTGGAAAIAPMSFDASLAEGIAQLQSMSRGSDVVGARVCEIVELQVGISRRSSEKDAA